MDSLDHDNTRTGLDIWRKLCRLERSAHDAATRYCNAEIDGDKWEALRAGVTAQVKALFGGKLPQGFFVNGDPRGYALKLDNEKVTIPDGMHKDFGGYGILAAVIE